MKLTVRPLELEEANLFVIAYHRHHRRAQGHRFSIGVLDEEWNLHAVAVVGRPVSGLDPTKILEVTRMCSDGTPNTCSMLYAAAARAGQALGYERIQTYLYARENGASLKASGWQMERAAHPSGRHRARSDGEARDTAHVKIKKTLWVRDLNVRTKEAGDPDKKYAHHRRKQA